MTARSFYPNPDEQRCRFLPAPAKSVTRRWLAGDYFNKAPARGQIVFACSEMLL